MRKIFTRYLRHAGLCAAVLGLVACGGGSTESMLASAKAHLAKNENKAAIIQLKNGLQQTPDNAEMRFLLGKTLLEVSDPAAASAELGRAADLKYAESLVFPLQAKALLAMRQFKAVVDRYARTELPEPRASAELKSLVALAYAALGDEDKATTAVDAALSLVPDLPQALLLRARIIAGNQKIDEALQIADRIIAVQPTYPDAWVFKGELLLASKGDAAGAKAAYEKAIAAKPDFVPARLSLVTLLLAQRDLPGADAQLAELRKLPSRPQLQTSFFEAELAYLKKDFQRAKELTLQLLRVAPNDAALLHLAGAVEFANGSMSQAENDLAKALQTRPDQPGARELLARVQLRMGQAAKALETLKPLLDGGQPSSAVFALAGEANLQLRDFKQAEANFANAAKLDPKNGKASTALAVVRLENGSASIDSTLNQLRLISDSDADTSADLALVSAQLRRNDFDGALKAIDVLERKQADKRPLAAFLRGQVYALRKDAARARANFERALVIDPTFVAAAANLAELDLADGQTDAARKRFDGILAADPKNLNALLAVAGLRARAGAPKDEVVALLANASKLNPGEVAPRALMIDHFLADKDFKRALDAAQNAIAAIPDSLELLDALGRAQLGAGEQNQAIATFKKLASLKPQAPEIHLRLAGAYMADKNPQEVERSFKRALEIRPDYLPAQRGLIDFYIAAKRPADALSVVRTVRQQRPAEAVGDVLKGAVEVAQSQFPAAIDAFRSALKKSAQTETAIKLHAALALAQKGGEASAFAEGWLKDKPDDAAFLLYLGENAIRLKDFAAAEGYFQRVVRLRPNNPSALNNLAWLTYKLGKPGALGYAQRANEQQPNSPALMDTLALALAADRQLDKAIEVQKKAVTLASSDSGLRLNLAKIYIQAGNKAAAKTELESLTKAPTPPDAMTEANQLLRSL